MPSSDDRREFQRLKLANPLLAVLNGQRALILDMGVTGAFVEHHGSFKPGDRMRLSFRWQGADVEFICEATRSNLIRPTGREPAVSHTAVAFVEPVGDAADRLAEMMATFVGDLLAAQRANAQPGSAAATSLNLERLGHARRSRTRGYLAYLWDGTAWTCRRTTMSDQPRNGFTVPAYEDEEDLERLCRAYEGADEEGQRLIRLVAELSVKSQKK